MPLDDSFSLPAQYKTAVEAGAIKPVVPVHKDSYRNGGSTSRRDRTPIGRSNMKSIKAEQQAAAYTVVGGPQSSRSRKSSTPGAASNSHPSKKRFDGTHAEKTETFGDGGVIVEGDKILYDLDGDGVISSMEYQLSTDALNNIEGRDLKGDGVVSAEEEKHTRILEGRKMILKSFIARNVTDLRQIGPRFCRKSPKEVLDMMMDDYADFGGFAVMLKDLEAKERIIKRNSSTQMFASMSQQNMQLHHSDIPRGTQTARLQHEERLNRALGQVNKDLNRTHGSIPGYGNFSNYASYMIRHNGHT